MASIGTARVDPARVHAVLVGLERYGEPSWRLPGPARDVLGFARWLRDRSVPAENIRLLITPIDGDKAYDRWISQESRDLGVPLGRVASRDEIMNTFTRDIANSRGEVLFVVWCGHGVLDRGEKRLLFCPDAHSSDKRCIEVGDLREYLAGTHISGFTRQIFLIDACAEFAEYRRYIPYPVPTPFPRVERRYIEQYALHATRSGQIAENNATAQGGVFSAAVLGWLKDHDELIPDLAALALYVKKFFTQSHTPGAPHQAPISVHTLGWDGSKEDIYFLPEDSGEETIESRMLSRIVREVIQDPANRAPYIRYIAEQCGLDNMRLERGDAAEKIAHLILHIPRAAPAFVERLRREGADAEAVLNHVRTLALPWLLSPAEYDELMSIFQRFPVISEVELKQCGHAALPFGPMLPDFLPQSAKQRHLLRPDAAIDQKGDIYIHWLENLVNFLEGYAGGLSRAWPGEATVPPLLRFTEHLAMAVPQRRGQLQTWAEKVAVRLGVSLPALIERRDDAKQWAAARANAAPAAKPRVVVELGIYELANTHSEGRYHFAVWSDVGTGELSRISDGDALPGGPGEIARIIRSMVSQVSASNVEPMIVEFLVYRDGLGVPVDTWDAGDPGDILPAILGIDHPVVLRFVDPISTDRGRQRQLALNRRWRNWGRSELVYLDDSHCGQHEAYGALSRDSEAARVVIGASRANQMLLVQLATAMGYPIVLWDREASSCVSESHFAPMNPRGDAQTLPHRVRTYRAHAHQDPERNPAQPCLVWEDASRPLPPILELSYPADPPQGAETQ